METWSWLFFPAVYGGVAILIVGCYAKVIAPLITIWQMWRHLLPLQKFNGRALWREFWQQVVLQKQLLQESRVRWTKHVFFIYWSAVGLLLLDLLFALFGKDRSNDDLVRLGLDFSLDFVGMVILVGVIFALVRAFLIRGTPQAIYNHTPAIVFIFFVVFSGFLLEAFRLASEPHQAYMNYSFLGSLMALPLRSLSLPWVDYYNALWLAHLVVVVAFFAYIPFSSLVHILTVPLGRLMYSQQEIREAKVQAVVKGLLGTREQVRSQGA